MTLMAHTRRPRIRFETVRRATADPLPRMDVVAFVGFAGSGPVHVPVAIEDAAQYARIFGDDPMLAWDPEEGEPVHAYLGSAVRAFFANGGRRCWVVRVAGDSATHAYLQMPGMLKSRGGVSAGTLDLEPAFARSRSVGSWSDTLRLQTTLRARPIGGVDCDVSFRRLSMPVAVGAKLGGLLDSGVMVRLRFVDEEGLSHWLYSCLEPDLANANHLPTRAQYRLCGNHWFSSAPPELISFDPSEVQVGHYRADDVSRQSLNSISAESPYDETPSIGCLHAGPGQLTWSETGQPQVTVAADHPAAQGFHPGLLLRIKVSGLIAWFVVRAFQRREERIESPASSVASETVDLAGELYWERPTPGGSFNPGRLRTAELLTVDLRVHSAGNARHEMQDIGLADGHPRYWGALRGDHRRYRPRPTDRLHPLVDEARETVFPLACPDEITDEVSWMYIPLGVPTVYSDVDLAAVPVKQETPAWQRDGLGQFNSGLFLDPMLADLPVRTLMSEADRLRYDTDSPRALRGIHAVLGFADERIGEEVTLIAVPDAVHRRWNAVESPEGHTVASIPATSSESAPATEVFQPCVVPNVEAPLLEAIVGPAPSGLITLEWNGESGALFELEEAATKEFEQPSSVYKGRDRRIQLTRPAGGRYAFRVRARKSGQTGGWSNTLEIRLAPARAVHLAPSVDGEHSVLLAVQSALLRLSAAHGEFFAVLGLPHHFREQQSRDYLGVLAAQFIGEANPSPLSYGAVYHPWLQCRMDDGAIVVMPPDGVVLGMLAARANERGAWVAPANYRLNTVVALTPPFPEELDALLNEIRQYPNGFMTLRADTLDADDPALRLISVRRLLIVLRRVALRYGTAFAFEPNGESLRGMVQHRFEQLLRGLYDRGAFAGNSPAQAYQVSTDASINTTAAADQGRFLVELRIRPSLPMEWIVVRLLQRGSELVLAEGR